MSSFWNLGLWRADQPLLFAPLFLVLKNKPNKPPGSWMPGYRTIGMQRPRGRGFPCAPAARGRPRQGQQHNSPQRNTFLAPLSIACVLFLPFQPPAPLSRQGTKHGGCKGVVVQGCGGIGVSGLGAKQIRTYERARATVAFQRKSTTSGVSLLQYSYFNCPWPAIPTKRGWCKRRRGAGV